MKISQHSVVAIHYTLTNDAGEELDSSSGADPLTYLHGTGGLIPGLEAELDGRVAGEAFSTVIQPAQAYGEIDPAMIQDVPLEALAAIDDLRIGMQLQTQDPNGHQRVLIVDAIGETSATLNANHELAGKVLHFEVNVESVRSATQEELDHGHSHGPGHSH